MKLHYMGRVILCDSCTETDGRLTLYQGGEPIMTIANCPLSAIEAEGGIIEHVPTQLEAAEDEINDLQAALAEASVIIARIRAQIAALGEGPTLTKLLAFLSSLKDILSNISE